MLQYPYASLIRTSPIPGHIITPLQGRLCSNKRPFKKVLTAQKRTTVKEVQRSDAYDLLPHILYAILYEAPIK